MIRSWSYSKLQDFEKCKFLAWLKHDQRIPEPERPLKPGQTEHAVDRGTRVHEHAENYVNGKLPAQIPEMKKFEAEFNHLRQLFTQGIVSLEGEWGVNDRWEPCDYGRAWHRSKVDAIVFPDEQTAIVIDYKTGKRFGNEVKHSEQTQLYALNAVMRYPKIETIHTELWYLDVDDIAIATFTRAQILRFKPNFDRRGRAVTSCTDFPPNPNVFSCQWCQYGPWNGGQCKDGVQRPGK